MKFPDLKTLPFLCCFFASFCLMNNAALAQDNTALREIDAVIIDGSAVRDSNAYMAFGMSRDGGQSYITMAGSDELIEIIAELHPEEKHWGQQADIFLIVRLEDKTWWMKDENDNWLAWEKPLMPSRLIPFSARAALEPVIEVTVLSGMVSQLSGELKFYMAYSDPEDGLQVNPVPFRVRISSDSNEEQAFELFEENISPNIILAVV